MSTNKIIEILGDQSDFLLNHTCKTIDKSLLHIPSPNTIDEIWMSSDRNTGSPLSAWPCRMWPA